MGSAVRKTHEQKMADLQLLIEQAKEEQKKYAQGVHPSQGAFAKRRDDPDDVDIDDLLGDEPVKKVREKKATSVARVHKNNKGQMVSFHTKEGQHILAPGVQYYVVRFNGRLHYKQVDSCIFLPDDWKEGDAIPGQTQQEEIDDILG